METGCLEVVVNRKSNTLIKLMRYAAILLAVCFCLLALFVHFVWAVPAVLFAAGFYFAWLESVVDYEYVYVDKELRVAKIQQKQRRKDLATYDLSKMEMLAPQGSDQLDRLKGKDLKTIDYSSGDDDNRSCRYELILEDGTRLILDMTGEYGTQILDILRTYYPRKVFRN